MSALKSCPVGVFLWAEFLYSKILIHQVSGVFSKNRDSDIASISLPVLFCVLKILLVVSWFQKVTLNYSDNTHSWP